MNIHGLDGGVESGSMKLGRSNISNNFLATGSCESSGLKRKRIDRIDKCFSLYLP